MIQDYFSNERINNPQSNFQVDESNPFFVELNDGGYRVKIVADSHSGVSRLTTMVCTYPRFVHSEMMTHRVFSRNAASSRAIPFHKVYEAVVKNPARPYKFTKNQQGMAGSDTLTEDERLQAEADWHFAKIGALTHAKAMSRNDIHKGQINRLLEPFIWMTATISSTKWRGFFAQRCHHAADPTLRHIAEMMRVAIETNQPAYVQEGDYHLPFIDSAPDGKAIRLKYGPSVVAAISAARCARTSYETQESKLDPESDIDLYNRLLDGPHWSPLEHVASVTGFPYPAGAGGNFGDGWQQLRKTYNNESFGE